VKGRGGEIAQAQVEHCRRRCGFDNVGIGRLGDGIGSCWWSWFGNAPGREKSGARG
jgi:hypothetical protein